MVEVGANQQPGDARHVVACPFPLARHCHTEGNWRGAGGRRRLCEFAEVIRVCADRHQQARQRRSAREGCGHAACLLGSRISGATCGYSPTRRKPGGPRPRIDSACVPRSPLAPTRNRGDIGSGRGSPASSRIRADGSVQSSLGAGSQPIQQSFDVQPSRWSRGRLGPIHVDQRK